MIVLVNPRATKPKNRRFPLSVLALAAVLEGKEPYAIIDGNVEDAPERKVEEMIACGGVEMICVTVMPGPQMASAIPICAKLRAKHPKIPIVWGGYFPSIYTDCALNARYVDYAVRGQGEDTLLELLEVV